MGPSGRGDSKVEPEDIILTYNDRDHYNALSRGHRGHLLIEGLEHGSTSQSVDMPLRA